METSGCLIVILLHDFFGISIVDVSPYHFFSLVSCCPHQLEDITHKRMGGSFSFLSTARCVASVALYVFVYIFFIVYLSDIFPNSGSVTKSYFVICAYRKLIAFHS